MKPNALQGFPSPARFSAPAQTPGPVPADPAPRPGPRSDDEAQALPPRIVGTVAVLVLLDARPDARAWAWNRLVVGSRPLRDVPGMNFLKVLGSGAGGGFGLAPSATHRGMFIGFDTLAHAQRFVDESPVLAEWRSHARELCVAVLQPYSSRGSWSGCALQPTATAPLETQGPIAALTRATIRPHLALKFWRLSPPAEASLAQAEGCLLAAGLGEAPLVRQATFSLWTDTLAMDHYARSGAHQQAIRVAYGGGFFSETMFVRFLPLQVRGSWQGRSYDLQAHG